MLALLVYQAVGYAAADDEADKSLIRTDKRGKVDDYFRYQEYVLERIWFDYLGIRYKGHGTMTWMPDEGFHIKAFLHKTVSSPSKPIGVRAVGVVPREKISSIYMKPSGFYWAVAPNVILADHPDLFLGSFGINFGFIPFSQKLERVIFAKHRKNPKYSGSALYEVSDIRELSDVLQSDLRINDQNFESRRNSSALSYTDEKGLAVMGRLIDNKYIDLRCELPSDHQYRTYSWRYLESAKDAFSILYGQAVSLLQREVYRASTKYIEIRKREEPVSLNFLPPFGEDIGLNKLNFVKLTEFLAQINKENSDIFFPNICRNIFRQMIEARVQKNSQTRELLLSTILEAALRNIDNRPFQKKKSEAKSWEVSKSLKQFLKNYLSDEWMPLSTEVMKAHTYLRDRNAHPDWLFKQGGALSKEETEKALDNMIFLSRFYGYMILTLAGFKNLEPKFPQPHKEQSPLVIKGSS